MNRGQRRAQWRARAARSKDGAIPGSASITLRVGELVLRGFVRAQGRGIADSLQHTLAAQLVRRGLPESWRQGATTKHVDGGALRFSPGATPEGIGQRLAQVVLECRTDDRR